MTTPTIPALPRPSFAGSFDNTVELGPPKSFLLYGDTGTQKTLSLGKLVKAGYFKKVLFINLDDGNEVLVSDPIVRGAMLDGTIEVITINTQDPGARQQIENVILEIAGLWRTPTGALQVNPNIPDFGYDLVFIDTVNLMHEVALADFQRTTYNAAGTKLDGLAAYGRVAEWMDEMIRLIHNSKRFAGGFVMHAKTVEEKTGATKIKPKMSGSFKDTIASIPSITAYLDYRKLPDGSAVVLAATVGESELYDSKNRYNLPSVIYGFDIAETYATIYKQIGFALPEPIAPKTLAAAAA